MDNEITGTEYGQPASPAETQAHDYACARPAHSLLDVLMPASPPQPKNARVVRLFDIDGVKDECRAPQAEARAAKPAREPSAREAAKAARKLSLFAAAGLS